MTQTQGRVVFFTAVAVVAAGVVWVAPRARRRYQELVEQQRELAEIGRAVQRIGDQALREWARQQRLRDQLDANQAACRRVGVFRDDPADGELRRLLEQDGDQ